MGRANAGIILVEAHEIHEIKVATKVSGYMVRVSVDHILIFCREDIQLEVWMVWTLPFKFLKGVVYTQFLMDTKTHGILL